MSIHSKATDVKGLKDTEIEIPNVSVDIVSESQLSTTDDNNDMRVNLWLVICNIEDLKHQMLMNYNESQFLKEFEEDRVFLKTGQDLYKYYLKQTKEFEDQRVLNKDLNRTRPYCEKYKIDTDTGQNVLYNILYAYAQYDLDIGYCQGMNYFVDLFWQNL